MAPAVVNGARRQVDGVEGGRLRGWFRNDGYRGDLHSRGGVAGRREGHGRGKRNAVVERRNLTQRDRLLREGRVHAGARLGRKRNGRRRGLAREGFLAGQDIAVLSRHRRALKVVVRVVAQLVGCVGDELVKGEEVLLRPRFCRVVLTEDIEGELLAEQTAGEDDLTVGQSESLRLQHRVDRAVQITLQVVDNVGKALQ